MDIRQSNTLNKIAARDEKDERHICPLQLDVIARCIELWSNPNDIVFTPFMGIGSEVYQAILMGRRAMGIELKESYYNESLINCENALWDYILKGAVMVDDVKQQ
jgi:DNA methylase N-4/N-6 domain protein